MFKYLFISLLITVILVPIQAPAYEWSSLGPTGMETYNFEVVGGGIVHEIICEEHGIMIFENDTWQEYSYGSLPVWDLEMIISATADFIVVMGDGTDSDGVYTFNFSNYEFNVLYWFQNPRFITYCPADSSFYAGGEEGLIKSNNGLEWTNVPYFDGNFCYDMEDYGNNYVVSAADDIHYSLDAGGNWTASGNYLPTCDLTVSESGTFYSIFPDQSYSSGLWSSFNQGDSWNVEFWSINMSCVEFDVFGYLFTGWEIQQATEFGVACWQTDIQELYFMNQGLPCFNTNKLTIHPLVECNNIVACTDQGLYMLTDYFTPSDPDQINPVTLSARNYPNPFNPKTTICFSLPEAGNTELKIFNQKGRLINCLYNGFCRAGKNHLDWNGLDDRNSPVASGIYYYQIITEIDQLQGKMILLK